MRSVIRSTAWLSSGYGALIVGGLVTAKILSLLIGPAGYGYLTLYGTLLAIGWAAATYGLPAVVTRRGAEALARSDQEQWRQLKTSAFAYAWAISLMAAVVLVVFRSPIGDGVVHRPFSLVDAGVLALALVCGAMAPVQMAVLRTEGRIREIALADGLTALGSAVTTIGIVMMWGDAGVVFAVSAAAAIRLLAFTRYAGRPPFPDARGWARVGRDLALLARATGPIMASMGVYNLPVFVVPILVVHLLGSAATGLYAAAFAIGRTYLGFLARVMGQDFYARIGRLPPESPGFTSLMHDQQELIIWVSLPMGVLLIAFAHIIVPIAYSPRFLPMVTLLCWLVAADAVRYMGTLFDLIVLAKCSPGAYLRVESVSGAATLLAMAGGLWLMGLEGVGIGWALGQICRFGYGARMVTRVLGIRAFGPGIPHRLAAAVAILGATLAFQAAMPPDVVMGVAGCAGAGLGVVSFRRLRSQWSRHEQRWEQPGFSHGSL